MSKVKEPAEKFRLRAAPPGFVRINRKITIALSALAALILITSTWYGLSPRKRVRAASGDEKAIENVYDTGMPENFSALPTSYSEVKRPEAVQPAAPEVSASTAPRLGPPAPGEVGAMRIHEEQRRASYCYGGSGANSGKNPLEEEREAALRSTISFKRQRGGGVREASAAETGNPSSDPAGGIFPPGFNLGIPSASDGEKLRYHNDQNRQGEKRHFLDSAPDEKTIVNASLNPAPSPFAVLAGTVIPASLITGINSDLPGELVAQVRENVYDTVSGGYLLIPQGSRLIGLYDSVVAYGQQRVLIAWNRLIMPNGDSIVLEGMPGVDLSGYAGLKDKVNHHFVRLISGVVLSSLLSVGARQSQGNVSGFQPSVDQDFARQIAGDINQTGQEITKKNLEIQPTIEVRPGFSFNVMVHKDLVLKPFTR